MFASLKNYILSIIYKKTTKFNDVDYEFYDEPFFLDDFEECDINV